MSKDTFLGGDKGRETFPVGGKSCEIDASDLMGKSDTSLLLFVEHGNERPDDMEAAKSDLILRRRLIAEKLEGKGYTIELQEVTETEAPCNITPPQGKSHASVYDDLQAVCAEVNGKLNSRGDDTARWV